MEKIGDSSSRRPYAVLLSNTVIQQDPRVSRFAKTLLASGWSVETIGLPPSNNDASETGLARYPLTADRDDGNKAPVGRIGKLSIRILLSIAGQLKKVDRRAAFALHRMAAQIRNGRSLTDRILYYAYLRFGAAWLPDRYAFAYWRSDPAFQGFLDTALQRTGPVDLWIANDWEMLPVALAARREIGGAILYDSHEYAVGQFMSNEAWRKWKRPLVKAVERDGVRQVEAVSSVSPGVCRALTSKYALAREAVCIRNAPAYQRSAFSPTGPVIKLLYQGVLARGRGLEELIASAKHWEPRFILQIRGPETQPGYLASLRRLAADAGAGVDIRFLKPAPFRELVAAARDADVGVMLLPHQGAQQEYALPNKIFEYMMAGLALCVSDSEEMAKLVKARRNGIVIGSLTPDALAEAVNALTPGAVDEYKRASLAAAETLNWENEQETLLALCRELAPHWQEQRAAAETPAGAE